MIIRDIKIEIVRKKIKNMNLSVRPPDAKVKISAPFHMNDDQIKAFAMSKYSWIIKKIDEIESLRHNTALHYISGETHYYQGMPYFLNILCKSGASKVEIRDNEYIDLYTKQHSTKKKREKIMREWYRKKLKEKIPALIEKWEAIIGVEINEWGVKDMKTRWGSCNIRAKRIWLNLELAKKTPRSLEYIIVHELIHLLERLHNPRFKAYMDTFMPNWRLYKKDLDCGTY